MRRSFCLCKVVDATVTDAVVEYDGSFGIDGAIMEAAGIAPYEKILLINVTNTTRLETYALREEAGSRKMALYGGAAKMGKIGDQLIIMTFGDLDEEEVKTFKGPRVIRLEKGNTLKR